MRLIYVAFFGIVARERGHAIYVAFLAGKIIEWVPGEIIVRGAGFCTPGER
jgi:hypothetical protein